MNSLKKHWVFYYDCWIFCIEIYYREKYVFWGQVVYKYFETIEFRHGCSEICLRVIAFSSEVKCHFKVIVWLWTNTFTLWFCINKEFSLILKFTWCECICQQYLCIVIYCFHSSWTKTKCSWRNGCDMRNRKGTVSTINFLVLWCPDQEPLCQFSYYLFHHDMALHKGYCMNIMTYQNRGGMILNSRDLSYVLWIM